jgi:ornithine cyclodeaminase/alanine dehydrogenase-like protein (mu-crystallin family)
MAASSNPRTQEKFTKPAGTLVLTQGDILALLTPGDCRRAVEEGFALHAEGRSLPPGVLGVHVPGGGFHIKAAGLLLERPYFVAKTNANLPENGPRFGLPTIQGTLVLCDAEAGYPLAIMDSMALTALRTAAATAVAAEHLARANARVATILGCGAQASAQLAALLEVCKVDRVLVHDLDHDRAHRFAETHRLKHGLRIEAADDALSAARASDICVTCTTSRRPILGPGDVARGAFIAAVGADNPVKQEIAPALMAASKIVVDSLQQCLEIGDLHHAVEAGAVRREDVYAEIGEIVAGRKPGRVSDDEIIVFDSTGTALQDVAAAAMAYRNAAAAGRGRLVDFAA